MISALIGLRFEDGVIDTETIKSIVSSFYEKNRKAVKEMEYFEFPDDSMIKEVYDFINEKKGTNTNDALTKKLMSWAAGNNTGMSSMTLWVAVVGCEASSANIPYDTADFKRCYDLLALLDEEAKKAALTEVARRHKIWVPYAREWEEMEKLFEQGGRVELYNLLSRLSAEAME